MDPATIGLLALLAILVLLALRVPIAFTMLGVATAAMFLVYATRAGGWMPGRAIYPTLSVLRSNSYDLVHSYELSMVPLFVALGNVAYAAGITTRIYDAAAVFLARLPGGLAIASVVGCGGFAAISGSSIACASTMGRICVPEMLRLGYDGRLATASVAAGGTLGALIPPSVLFILYGIFTETSISSLFLAGIVPGLISMCAFAGVIMFWALRRPKDAPVAVVAEGQSRRETLIRGWPALALFVIIVGGIYGGIFTATEAAAVSLVLTMIVGFAGGKLTFAEFWDAMRVSLVQTASIFLIAAAAKVFVSLIALTGTAGSIVGWIEAQEFGPLQMMLVIAGIYLVLGMFLDPIGTMVLTLPFVVPLVEGQGMHLIWFGVIVVKLLEIGLITPPVGLNVFVINSVVPQVSIGRTFSGLIPFLTVDLMVLLLLLLLPGLSLFLPLTMG